MTRGHEENKIYIFSLAHIYVVVFVFVYTLPLFIYLFIYLRVCLLTSCIYMYFSESEQDTSFWRN